MPKKSLPATSPAEVPSPVLERIREILEQARAQVARSVNTEMVRAYWLVGREIVEEEQRGKARAGYGDELIAQLSTRLRAIFARGFTPSNLRYMRLFYLAYPELLGPEIHHAVRDESGKPADRIARIPARRKAEATGVLNPDLSWTHYRLLTKVESVHARSFYEIETARNRWSSRELERQINSLLFERLAKSRDKKGLMRLAKKGQEVLAPEDVFKDPVVLEFVGLPESHRLGESELEDALLTNLQAFLLEPGDERRSFRIREEVEFGSIEAQNGAEPAISQILTVAPGPPIRDRDLRTDHRQLALVLHRGSLQ